MPILLFSFTVMDDAIKPHGNSQAVSIYNQTYSENIDPDHIDDIIKDAKNAYVIIDPFEPGIAGTISDIKANHNEVGGYISIGTEEDWREDFTAMKPFSVSRQWAEWGCDWVEFDNMDRFFDDGARHTF